MINIAHPPVSSKPPLKKCNIARTVGKKFSTCHERDVSCHQKFEKSSKISSKDNNGTGALIATLPLRDHHDDNEKGAKQTGSDCNQNVIEPDSSSFQQLCNMISDLEQNMSIGGASVDMEGTKLKKKNSMEFDTPNNGEDTLPGKYLNQDQPEKDNSKNVCISNGSSYEDIMHFLTTLEQDTAPLESIYDGRKNFKRPETRNIGQYPETLKEDLSTALLQLEDREATIKLLKNELKTERKMACDKLDKQKKEHCTELQAERTKCQAVVKRHQKFIEQLITEKKDLTEKCNALAVCIKDSETKRQRELKCALDRHAIELQRAKEICAASEKVRRERWLEAKTCKIKEMTVKGLEPELRGMVEQHQQEIQDIRSTHMKELQDVELRTIRRSNQQLEQLRLELTASHDKIVASEREALRVRFQEKYDEQEALVQAQQSKFFEELQQERKRFADEQSRRDAERDLVVKQTTSQFNEKIEMLKRQHQVEKRTLQESLDAEREVWIENYRRQQKSKFEMAQARIMDECNRERDRQIEIAIARLEKETRDMKANLQKNWENKLRCLKEEYEAKLEEANKQYESVKGKLELAQEKLKGLENHVEKTEERLGKCLAELNQVKQSIDGITMERDHSKKIARQEIESEKRELENKIASLYREITENNANRDSVMAQLYSRIKLIVTQKDLTIKKITREVSDTKEKCQHLEQLLDQQRKEYVLKSL